MPFDYSKSGLPDNEKWKAAAAVCNQWLNENMSMFGPERIASFMEHQPIAAAKLILANCGMYSEESITLVLLGPAKGILLSPTRDEIEANIREQVGEVPEDQKEEAEAEILEVIESHVAAYQNRDAQIRQVFGDRAIELMKYVSGLSAVQFDTDMPLDATRLFLVEGLSTMNDQLIGRARIDKHHQVRWDILKGLEQQFAAVKGQNPALDAIFEAALVKSRDALEALDKAPKREHKNKGPKPPTL